MKKSLTKERERYIIDNAHGDMAQLVERLVRNEEASGSNPLISTKKNKTAVAVLFFVDNRENRCIISGSRERAKTTLHVFFSKLFASEALA